MANYESRPCVRAMKDPFTGKSYDYSTKGNDQAERLYQALELALADECPPDRKDYLCQAGEDEDTSEANCRRCILRWATAPFGKYRN